MDAVPPQPATGTLEPQPQFHIEPRRSTNDNHSVPPFHAQFSSDGRTLVLLTPETRECYRAETGSAG